MRPADETGAASARGSELSLFTAELRTLLRSYGPKNYGMQGFCPIAEGNLIGKTRYVRSLKGCEQ